MISLKLLDINQVKTVGNRGLNLMGKIRNGDIHLEIHIRI